MRKFIKKISHPFLKLIIKIWHSKPRKYSYKGINVLVHPDVFPPHYTISTKILLDFVDGLEIENKTFLELGCGSGIISLFAASKGAIVTATDINDKAIEYLKISSTQHNLSLTILHSDLFSELHYQSFEYIFINPPYYPKTPKNHKEQAWFCGENFEYFKKLFFQLSNRNKKETIYMILSEDCDLLKIKAIANKYNFKLKLIFEKKVLQEKNYIFKIS